MGKAEGLLEHAAAYTWASYIEVGVSVAHPIFNEINVINGSLLNTSESLVRG